MNSLPLDIFMLPEEQNLAYLVMLCSIPPWMWMGFCLGLCYLNLLICFHHWLLQPFFFLPINNSLFSLVFLSLNTYYLVVLLLVVPLISTTFTFVMIVCVSAIGWTFVIITHFPWNIFCISVNFGQSIILCPFKPQMWHAYEDVFYGFWLGYVAFVVTTVVYFFFFLHVFTLWFIISQFVQYLLVFLVLFYVFVNATCLIFCDTDSALFASVVAMLSSHNIVAFLCYSVDHFILRVRFWGMTTNLL